MPILSSRFSNLAEEMRGQFLVSRPDLKLQKLDLYVNGLKEEKTKKRKITMSYEFEKRRKIDQTQAFDVKTGSNAENNICEKSKNFNTYVGEKTHKFVSVNYGNLEKKLGSKFKINDVHEEKREKKINLTNNFTKYLSDFTFYLPSKNVSKIYYTKNKINVGTNYDLKVKIFEKKIKNGNFGVLDSLERFRLKMKLSKKELKQRRRDEDKLEKNEAMQNSFPYYQSQAPSSPLSPISSRVSSKSSCSSSPSSFNSSFEINESKVPLKKRITKFFYEMENNEISQNLQDNESSLSDSTVLKDNNFVVSKFCIEKDNEDKIFMSKQNKFGDSLLHISIRDNNQNLATSLVKSMNEKHISIDLYNHSKETPLLLCVKLNNLRIMKNLLKYGASCNVPGADGNNALHLAAKMKNLKALNLIFNHSVVFNDISHRNNKSQTFADIADENGISRSYLQDLLDINFSNMIKKLKKF